MKVYFIKSKQQEMLILLACLHVFSAMFWLNNSGPTPYNFIPYRSLHESVQTVIVW